MIKILEIIGDSSLAGAPRHLLSILENIDTDKYALSVVCPPGPLAGEIRKMRRRIVLEVVPMRSRLDTKSIRKIRRIIKHLKPDLVHIHGTRAGLLARLAAIGLNKRIIYTEHLWTEQFKLKSHWLNFLHYASNWFLDMFTTLNIAVSDAVKNFLVNSNITHEDKVKVIYNGISPSEKQAKVLNNDKEIQIATVGTLNPQKGIQYLIKAMIAVKKEFPSVLLEIVGDGGYKKALQNEVRKLKLKDNVKFVGFIPDVESYLTKFDLYVQPSLSESFGLAIAQAMSVGLPVVATDAGGIPEVVINNRSGILVEAKNDKVLAEAILELLRDPARARKMGETARKEAKLRFNIKDMIDELEATYEETAEHAPFIE